MNMLVSLDVRTVGDGNSYIGTESTFNFLGLSNGDTPGHDASDAVVQYRMLGWSCVDYGQVLSSQFQASLVCDPCTVVISRSTCSYKPNDGLTFAGFTSKQKSSLQSVTIKFVSPSTQQVERSAASAGRAKLNAKHKLQKKEAALKRFELESESLTSEIKSLEATDGTVLAAGSISFAEIAKRSSHATTPRVNALSERKRKGRAMNAAKRRATAKSKKLSNARRALARVTSDIEEAQRLVSAAAARVEQASNRAREVLEELAAARQIDSQHNVSIYVGIEYACGGGHRFIDESEAKAPSNVSVKEVAPQDSQEQPKRVFSWPQREIPLCVPCKCCLELAQQQPSNRSRQRTQDNKRTEPSRKVPDASAQVKMNHGFSFC